MNITNTKTENINGKDIDPLLKETPANEAQSNDRIQLALQDLYLELLNQDKVGRVDIMEDAEPPKTIPDQRDLVVRKIRAIEAALS